MMALLSVKDVARRPSKRWRNEVAQRRGFLLGLSLECLDLVADCLMLRPLICLTLFAAVADGGAPGTGEDSSRSSTVAAGELLADWGDIHIAYLAKHSVPCSW